MQVAIIKVTRKYLRHYPVGDGFQGEWVTETSFEMLTSGSEASRIEKELAEYKILDEKNSHKPNIISVQELNRYYKLEERFGSIGSPHQSPRKLAVIYLDENMTVDTKAINKK